MTLIRFTAAPYNLLLALQRALRLVYLTFKVWVALHAFSDLLISDAFAFDILSYV